MKKLAVSTKRRREDTEREKSIDVKRKEEIRRKKLKSVRATETVKRKFRVIQTIVMLITVIYSLFLSLNSAEEYYRILSQYYLDYVVDIYTHQTQIYFCMFTLT